jgi:aspartyl-tRNA(Asn)/glutamyl-tRNA(Gln) amidotransferase subunit C
MNDRALSPDAVRQVGHLARLQLTDAEVQRLTADLNQLLTHFEELEQVDTEGVPPTFHVLELSNVLRDDEVTPSLSIDDVLANAPRSDGRFFVVPRVVDTD